MTRIVRALAICLLGMAAVFSAAPAGEDAEKTFERTGDFLPLFRENLRPEPWTCGAPPFADRAAWARIAQRPGNDAGLAEAERYLGEDFPMPSDELYLHHSKTGDRATYGKFTRRISNAMDRLPYAYLVTGDRRYLDKWQGIVRDFIGMKSWTESGIDRDLSVFKGETRVDLATSKHAWCLSLCWRLLHDQMDPELADALKKEINRRTIQVLEDFQDGKRKPHWFVTSKMNWNSVCFTRMAGAILALEDDPARRLKLLSYCLENIDNSLDGFESDGYCGEGVAYWDYGYRSNMIYAIMMRQVTGGAVDLMRLPRMRRPADFPERIQILPGLYPSTADSSPTVRIKPNTYGMRDYLADRPSKAWATMFADDQWGLGEMLLYACFEPRPDTYPEGEPALAPLSRFPAAGIAVARPDRPGLRLAAFMKFGDNLANHHHRDIGTFDVVLDGVQMVQDPGGENYTARTFSPRRFESNVLNSFGHPVPRIGENLQVSGKNTRCPELADTVEPDLFVWRADLRPAYRLKTLKRLEREFRYDRNEAGSFTVSDTMAAAEPVAFESALITLGNFKATGPTTGEIVRKGKTLKVTVTSDAPFSFVRDEIKEDTKHRTPIWRVAVRLDKPAASAAITIRMEPQ